MTEENKKLWTIEYENKKCIPLKEVKKLEYDIYYKISFNDVLYGYFAVEGQGPIKLNDIILVLEFILNDSVELIKKSLEEKTIKEN